MASAWRKTQHLFILELLLPHVWTLLICFRPSCHSKRLQLLRTKRFYTTKKEEKPCSNPARTDRRRTVAIILCFQNHNSPQDSNGVSRLQLLILFFSKMAMNVWLRMFFYGLHRGGSRGRVQGVRTPPEMTCGFLIQLVFCKKKLCGLLEETSAPPPKSCIRPCFMGSLTKYFSLQ